MNRGIILPLGAAWIQPGRGGVLAAGAQLRWGGVLAAAVSLGRVGF